MASVLVAHMLSTDLRGFLFEFEATKRSLDGFNAQQPLFVSIYNGDLIGID